MSQMQIIPSQKQYQVIQKQHGFFWRSTEIIFKPEYFKSPVQVEHENLQRDLKRGPPLFRTTRITNIVVNGHNTHNNFKF